MHHDRPAPIRPGAAARLLHGLAAALAALVALAAADPARGEGLVISLSNHQVMITSNYTGSQITVFGAVQRDEQTIARTTGYDAAVIVRGPRVDAVTVRRKERLGPIWINRSQQTFMDIPRYLAILSSRPLDELTSEIMRMRLHLDLDPTIASRSESGESGALLYPRDAPPEYAEALVRLRMQEGQYFEIGRGVTFITPTIFRAAIPLPAGAPPGNYEVETLLFSDGVQLSRDITNFELVKTGFEQRVAVWAETRAAAYGFLTVLMAIFFGWIASVIFRRD